MKLYINEIFHSLQGETTRTGLPGLFIRLAGCNLKCNYCDTAYARLLTSGKEMAVTKILEKAKAYKGINHVTITGGEPLMQPASIKLMHELVNRGFDVQLETNGSLSLEQVPAGVRKMVDVKTPSSGEGNSFLFENLNYLLDTDELKFVILNINDYEFSGDFIKKYLQKKKSIINFSPVYEKFPAAKLADLILKDNLQVRLNLQLHKIIWPEGEPK